MKSSIISSLAALFLSFASVSAIAEDGKLYGALDIGQATAKDACTGLPSTMSCSDTVTAYRLGLGYQVNSNVAVEGSYSPSAKITTSGTYLGFPTTGEESSSTFQLAVIGSYPVTEHFALVGKVGMAFIDAKASVNVGGSSASDSNNNTNLAYGLGVLFPINNKVAVRVMYEYFGTVKASSTDTGGKLTYLSAGLQVGF